MLKFISLDATLSPVCDVSTFAMCGIHYAYRNLVCTTCAKHQALSQTELQLNLAMHEGHSESKASAKVAHANVTLKQTCPNLFIAP
jgi:hypothetical protein